MRILPTATNTTLSELLCGEVNFTSVGIFIKKMEERRSYHERDGAPCQDKVLSYDSYYVCPMHFNSPKYCFSIANSIPFFTVEDFLQTCASGAFWVGGIL